VQNASGGSHKGTHMSTIGVVRQKAIPSRRIQNQTILSRYAFLATGKLDNPAGQGHYKTNGYVLITSCKMTISNGEPDAVKVASPARAYST
jgi:hypothetical protein